MAEVRGAFVCIIAIGLGTREASSRDTMVVRSACVTIVAGGRIIAGKDTTRGFITCVVRAHISIIARQHLNTQTGSPTANIVGRTEVPVIATGTIACVLTGQGRIARIVRTLVIVIARKGTSRRAGAIRTGVAFGTGAAIITRIRIVVVDTPLQQITAICRADIGIVAIDLGT